MFSHGTHGIFFQSCIMYSFKQSDTPGRSASSITELCLSFNCFQLKILVYVTCFLAIAKSSDFKNLVFYIQAHLEHMHISPLFS